MRSVWGGRLFQQVFVIVLFGSLMVHQSDGRQIDRRRINLINEWIDRIRSAPKGKAFQTNQLLKRYITGYSFEQTV